MFLGSLSIAVHEYEYDITGNRLAQGIYIIREYFAPSK